MDPEKLKKAINLAERTGYILIATATPAGVPHLGAAGKIVQRGNVSLVAVEAWFCPGTVANLNSNRSVALVIWDPNSDTGYQLLGEAEGMEDVSMMDGYDKRSETKPFLPQVERRFTVRIKEVLDFSLAPHTDK